MKKMRKLFCGLLSLILVLELIPIPAGMAVFSWLQREVSAESRTWSGTCGNSVEWELAMSGADSEDDESTADYSLVISGSGVMTDYTNTLTTDWPWSSWVDKIDSIVIESGVTSIGNYAFRNLSVLKEVELADSVTTIGVSAFDSCAKLQNIELGNSVKNIKSNAFHGCSAMQSISLPDSLETIGTRAFSDTGLVSITIPKGVVSIVSNPVYQSSALKTIQVAEGNVKYQVIDNVLYENKNGNPYLALGYPVNAESKEVTIAEGTVEIGHSAFIDCELTMVTLPETLETIGYAAFQYNRFTKVTLPDSLKSIGAFAFQDTSYATGIHTLTEVSVGKCLEEFVSNSFYDCINMEKITIDEENPYLDAVDSVVYTEDYSTLCFYAPAKTETVYHMADTVVTIAEGAINNTTKLEKLFLSAKIEEINEDIAIYNNTNLKNIYFPANAPVVSEDALLPIASNAENCIIYVVANTTGWDADFWSDFTMGVWNPDNIIQEEGILEKIAWTYSATDGSLVLKGKGSVPDFESMEDAPWGDYMDEIQSVEAIGVTGVGDYCFANAEELLRVEFEDCKQVGDNAFSNCAKLTYIYLEKVNDIGAEAFYGCSDINSDIYFETLNSLGKNAFQGCTGITVVTLGEKLVTLEQGVFADCTALEYIIIPESVTKIAAEAFSGCTKLRTINIPEEIIEISSKAFFGATSLEKVYFYGDKPFTWADDSFDACHSELILYYRKGHEDWKIRSWNNIPVLSIEEFYSEKDDHYSFKNFYDSFGYSAGDKIPKQRFKELFTASMATYYYRTFGEWTGSCFGMAASSLAFYEDNLDINTYDVNAQNLYDVMAPKDKNSDLTALIEKYQISQLLVNTHGVEDADNSNRNIKNHKAIIQLIEEFERSGGLRVDSSAEPIIMILNGRYACHAVVPVSIAQTSEGDYAIKVFDSNSPINLQTVKIDKSLESVTYQSYTSASFIKYTDLVKAIANAKSSEDKAVYLSVDKENVEICDKEGNAFEQIKNAYEQKLANGESEDEFPGIRRFVLPEGEYEVKLSEESSQELDAGVTYYMATSKYFVQATSSDKNASFKIVEGDTTDSNLQIELTNQEENAKSEFTIVDSNGKERTLEVNGSDALVTLSEEEKITVETVNTDAEILMDGKEVAVTNGIAILSFAAEKGENPLHGESLITDLSCDNNNLLNGTISAIVSSNASEERKAKVKLICSDTTGKEIAAYIQETVLQPGSNDILLNIDKLSTAFSTDTGEIELVSKLVIEDEEGYQVILDGEFFKVTLTKQIVVEPPSVEDIPEETAVTSVKVTPKKLVLGKGEKCKLKVNVLPSNASDKTVTYHVSGKAVKVSKSGKITAKKKGKATITVKTTNGKSAVVKVTVKNAPKKISLNAKKKVLKKKKSFKIKVKLPKNTASYKITYSSSKKSVAKVSSSGKVTAKKKGKATITVKTFNGKKAKIKITVK